MKSKMMTTTTKSTSFFEKTINPFLQSGVILCAGLVVMLLTKLLINVGILQLSDRFPYMISAAFVLFYAIFNSIFSLTADDMNKYWFHSTIAFAGLTIASAFLAYMFCGIKLEEAGSFKWIYTVLGFCYLVFLSILRGMKRIVFLAQQEDREMDALKK